MSAKHRTGALPKRSPQRAARTDTSSRETARSESSGRRFAPKYGVTLLCGDLYFHLEFRHRRLSVGSPLEPMGRVPKSSICISLLESIA